LVKVPPDRMPPVLNRIVPALLQAGVTDNVAAASRTVPVFTRFNVVVNVELVTTMLPQLVNPPVTAAVVLHANIEPPAPIVRTPATYADWPLAITRFAQFDGLLAITSNV